MEVLPNVLPAVQLGLTQVGALWWATLIKMKKTWAMIVTNNSSLTLISLICHNLLTLSIEGGLVNLQLNVIV